MSKPRFEDYEFEIRRIKAEDGGGYTITFPDLPGCRSDGETPSEAENNGREAFETWMDSCIADGRDVPTPGTRDESPAKFLQRVPKYVHAQLVDVSGQQGVSVNSLVTGFIIAGLERIQIQMDQAAGAISYQGNSLRYASDFGSTMSIVDEMESSMANSSSVLMRWDDRTDAAALSAKPLYLPQRRRVHG
jgi:antitoxin HicB